MAEAAGLPGYEASTWQGLLFPRNTPAPIVQRMHSEVVAVLALPDVRKRLGDLGYEPVGSTSAQFRAFIETEIAKWAKVIKSAGIKLH